MTEKKKHFVSLSVKPLFVLLLGLVLGVCVCLLANFTGEQIIERSYMSDKAVLKRTNRAAQEFQSFVRQNSISTRDTDMLARWGESRKNYYIMLYHDQRQILEIGWWGADSAAVDAYSLKEQMASVVYPIVFRDGTFYAVIYDNSDSGLYDLLWIVSLLLGCAVLALTLLAYNRRIARRVVAISQEVQSIGAGNLYLQLEPKGRDEISQLTASVEQMRLSLLRKTSEEQRALQQNSDLITAMSHDIRNPLTALLGYLDLAKNGQYRSEDELQSYLDAAYGKAEQLKTLTDELFRYSLLFGCKELPMQMEIYDARLLLEQLLGESRVQLQQQGFMVQLLPGATDAEIDQLEKNINAMPSVTELLHAGKTPEDMMKLALAGFTPNVLDERTVQYQCDCSAERTKEMLLSLGRAELVRMRDEDPNCEVVCHFCHSKYQYDLNALLAEYDAQAAQAAEAEHPVQ